MTDLHTPTTAKERDTLVSFLQGLTFSPPLPPVGQFGCAHVFSGSGRVCDYPTDDEFHVGEPCRGMQCDHHRFLPVWYAK